MPFTVKPKLRKETMALLVSSLSDCSPEEKKQKLHSIQVLYALELFDTKQYKESMKEFIKLKTDPADVIKLFPELDKSSGNKHKKLKGKDLEVALKALIEYLVGLKRNIINNERDTGSSSRDETDSPKNVNQQLELIDTTLLKCYLQTNNAVVNLIQQNNCCLEEAEKILLHHQKYSELVMLYETKGQHMKALQVLREEAKNPDSPFGDYHETKKYLQRLGPEHINLIFHFSDWILKEHPEEGLKIFTEDNVNVKKMPRSKILDFLLGEHKNLVIVYLEHVIHAWNETNEIFHEALINMYKDKITNKMADVTVEELQYTREKLIAFLEKSPYYTPEKMLQQFPTDSLYEEHAIILGKLGRHDQTLGFYVYILGDIPKAIRYCGNVFASYQNKNQDVYIILIQILMNPASSEVLDGPLANAPKHPAISLPDMETALSILEKYAERISPLKALTLLPDSVPLDRLKIFLENALHVQLTLKRRMQISKALSYAEHVQVQELKQFHESKSFVIDDDNVCLVCKKRFGNRVAVIRYPNGHIVHYSCKLVK